MSNSEEQMSTKDFLTGAIVGGVVGAAVALMLAPKSGKELRDDLNGQVENIKGKTGGWRELATEKSNQLASQAAEKTKQVRDFAVQKGSQFKDNVKQTTNQVKNEASEMKKEVPDHPEAPTSLEE
ncbi:YtxH domain-containing protein [Heyndrickxia acidiproducens]|jgi:gas vesicle protein|uniref:YtxH domain-containing protein n=1 Tax=Heyndrickxia acidiproducens TaxID=1121084 RepID=UPI0003663B89|nr:YtxH domain-containing protein [Heyndrickxia acidiproducens]